MANAKAISAKIPKKKASPKSPAKPSPAVDDAVPEVTGSQQHYESFLDAARAVGAGAVRPYRLDPSLAYHNVERGVAALLPLTKRIQEELPKVDMDELRSLPDLALALGFAASLVDRDGGGSADLPALLAEAYGLRETMLTSAVALAAAGLVPRREVEKIQEGRGAIDAAQDCVDLAAFFHRHAAVARGKTAVTAAQISRAATVGTELLRRLRKKTVKRDESPKGALKEALDVRDRMATVLIVRHETARRAAHWLWGDALDKYVPALQARATTKGKTDKKSSGTKAGPGKASDPAAKKDEKGTP